MKRLILMLAVLICASSSFAYYNSEQGRWLNRDPIGEAGGKNLVGFLNNCALNKIDLLGWSDNAPGGKCYVLIRVSHGMSHGRNNNNEKYGKDVAGAGSNWDDYQNRDWSGMGNSGVCYVGCGLNQLNRMVVTDHPANGVPFYTEPMDSALNDAQNLVRHDSFDEEQLDGLHKDYPTWPLNEFDSYSGEGAMAALLEAAIEASMQSRCDSPSCCESVTFKIEVQKSDDVRKDVGVKDGFTITKKCE